MLSIGLSFLFQPILDRFIPNFKLKCEDSENFEADLLSIVAFNLCQIKHMRVLGTSYKDVFSNHTIFISLSFKYSRIQLVSNQIHEGIRYGLPGCVFKSYHFHIVEF